MRLLSKKKKKERKRKTASLLMQDSTSRGVRAHRRGSSGFCVFPEGSTQRLGFSRVPDANQWGAGPPRELSPSSSCTGSDAAELPAAPLPIKGCLCRLLDFSIAPTRSPGRVLVTAFALISSWQVVRNKAKKFQPLSRG